MRSLIRSGMERASPPGAPIGPHPSLTLPDGPAAPVPHTGLLHEGSTKGDQPPEAPHWAFSRRSCIPQNPAQPFATVEARRRLVQPRHTPHTLQVWLRTSAERHETERQKRARFLL